MPRLKGSNKAPVDSSLTGRALLCRSHVWNSLQAAEWKQTSESKHDGPWHVNGIRSSTVLWRLAWTKDVWLRNVIWKVNWALWLANHSKVVLLCSFLQFAESAAKHLIFGPQKVDRRQQSKSQQHEACQVLTSSASTGPGFKQLLQMWIPIWKLFTTNTTSHKVQSIGEETLRAKKGQRLVEIENGKASRQKVSGGKWYSWKGEVGYLPQRDHFVSKQESIKWWHPENGIRQEESGFGFGERQWRIAEDLDAAFRGVSEDLLRLLSLRLDHCHFCHGGVFCQSWLGKRLLRPGKATQSCGFVRKFWGEYKLLFLFFRYSLRSVLFICFQAAFFWKSIVLGLFKLYVLANICKVTIKRDQRFYPKFVLKNKENIALNLLENHIFNTLWTHLSKTVFVKSMFFCFPRFRFQTDVWRPQDSHLCFIFHKKKLLCPTNSTEIMVANKKNN